MVSKCGENSTEPIQLAVLRALLTITTAEHFVVHGDALMQVLSYLLGCRGGFLNICKPKSCRL